MTIRLKSKKNHRTLRKGEFLNRGTYAKVIEGAVVINEQRGDRIETWPMDLSLHYVTINQ